jgi:hypothetical protein
MALALSAVVTPAILRLGPFELERAPAWQIAGGALMVIHDQDVSAGHLAGPVLLGLRGSRRSGCTQEGQADDKLATVAWAFALGHDAASVHLYQAAD